MTAVLARPLPGRAAQRQPGTVERGVVWGGAAGACVGAAVGTGLGFVIGFAVGAAVGWIAGACLGLAGGLALCLPRAAVSPLRARVVAGLVPALVVGAVFVRVPGTWVAASAFAATCLAVGAAAGPTVAFGPATRPTRPGRPGQPGQPWAPYGPGLLLLGAVLGAPVGAVAGVQAAAPVAAFASPGWSVLIAGGWVGAVVGACGGTVLAAVRSNPAASSA